MEINEMDNVISIDQFKKKNPSFLEGKSTNLYDKKRIIPIRNFFKVCAQMGYSFDEILTTFIESHELLFHFQPIVEALNWEEFDLLINDCQDLFKNEQLFIEKTRSSFLGYQLSQMFREGSYIPFEGNWLSTHVQTRHVESLLEDTLYHYFPLKSSGGESC